MAGRQVLQYGELHIHGDFDPDEATRRLAITPTRTARRGEPRKHTKAQHEWSSWTWQTPERAEPDGESLVLEVVRTFEPVSEVLAQLRSDYRVGVTVGLVVHMPESDAVGGTVVSTPALAFEPSTLSRLAALGCQLDFDLYVDMLDRDESAPA